MPNKRENQSVTLDVSHFSPCSNLFPSKAFVYTSEAHLKNGFSVGIPRIVMEILIRR